MTTTVENHFEDLVNQVQSSSQSQKPERLISGIAQQMQQSSNPQTQQLGAELKQIQSQLVKACQQQGG